MNTESPGSATPLAPTERGPERPLCLFNHAALARIRFARRGQVQNKCLRHALVHPPLVRTAAVTALVVGTILTSINQGNVLLAGTYPAALLWKVPLTYCVPYCVATFSALRISRIG